MKLIFTALITLAIASLSARAADSRRIADALGYRGYSCQHERNAVDAIIMNEKHGLDELYAAMDVHQKCVMEVWQTVDATKGSAETIFEALLSKGQVCEIESDGVKKLNENEIVNPEAVSMADKAFEVCRKYAIILIKAY